MSAHREFDSIKILHGVYSALKKNTPPQRQYVITLHTYMIILSVYSMTNTQGKPINYSGMIRNITNMPKD
jgi:hypothetical protein